MDARLGQPARRGDLPAALAGQRQPADLCEQGLLPQLRCGGRFFFWARHVRSPFGRYRSTDITDIAYVSIFILCTLHSVLCTLHSVLCSLLLAHDFSLRISTQEQAIWYGCTCGRGLPYCRKAFVPKELRNSGISRQAHSKKRVNSPIFLVDPCASAPLHASSFLMFLLLIFLSPVYSQAMFLSIIFLPKSNLSAIAGCVSTLAGVESGFSRTLCCWLLVPCRSRLPANRVQPPGPRGHVAFGEPNGNNNESATRGTNRGSRPRNPGTINMIDRRTPPRLPYLVAGAWSEMNATR